MTDQVNAREIVLDMLLEVLEGDKYSHTVLNHTLKQHQKLSKQDRAFITRLFQGSVKVAITLDYVINQFSSLPTHKMKPLIRNLLRLSIYQLLYMDQVPVSAVCNEAVKLAKKRGFTKLSGFVNGILRNCARNSQQLRFPEKEKEPAFYLEIQYSFPAWIIKELLNQYDFDTVEAILAASLSEKETSIRCNQKKASPQQLKELLIKEGVTVEDSAYLPYAFKIRDYDYLDKLQAFREGYFTVQDVSSMLVCEVAGIREQDYVVDVCAAPGGKALHAAEHAHQVSARDLTEYKTKLINENIKRMDFTNVTTKVWDATLLDEEVVGKADVVIADLPCSGMGVFGKKPDIKYKLTQNQHKELVELQRQILGVVQHYVKDNGILIFSTCTINLDENLGNRVWFLQNYEFEEENLDDYLPDCLKGPTTSSGYLQLLPGFHSTDGFFISKFRKRPSALNK